MPAPISPTAKRMPARSPASGRSASAASAALLMSVLPALKSVSALARMMKYITRFENAMPTFTSIAEYRISAGLAPIRDARVFRPISTSSSTSSLDCQKKR